MLQVLDKLPDGLLAYTADQLQSVLGGPTLIHLPGRIEPPLFVSVLMHGNETVGWDALRQLLPRYAVAGGEQALPRSLSIFIGNVAAAEQSVRHLDGQPDYNRVWPGCEREVAKQHSAEALMMQQVVDAMRQRDVFAAIDIHNNTGLNPHYACINVINDAFLHLATLFGRTVVFFTDPCQVASNAMARLCPSVTLECGKVGQQHGIDHATQYLDACLHLSEFPEHAVAEQDYDLFHTVATVKIPPEVSFSFGEHAVDLCLLEDIEYLNFRELPAGTHFARLARHNNLPLDVRNEQGEQVRERYFRVDGDQLLLATPVMPSMLTTNETVIRQDCLCYLMERYQI
ncbi:MAG: M14 family metallopeptidase [Chromatiales bacterium]|jgi:succinylglutamate desuccinylase